MGLSQCDMIVSAWFGPKPSRRALCSAPLGSARSYAMVPPLHLNGRTELLHGLSRGTCWELRGHGLAVNRSRARRGEARRGAARPWARRGTRTAPLLPPPPRPLSKGMCRWPKFHIPGSSAFPYFSAVLAGSKEPVLFAGPRAPRSAVWPVLLSSG